MNISTKVSIQGNATVACNIPLAANEISAAENMAELIATFQLLAIDLRTIGNNEHKFSEIATKFNLPIDRVKEIFGSLKTIKFDGQTSIGPANLNY